MYLENPKPIRPHPMSCYLSIVHSRSSTWGKAAYKATISNAAYIEHNATISNAAYIEHKATLSYLLIKNTMPRFLMLLI